MYIQKLIILPSNTGVSEPMTQKQKKENWTIKKRGPGHTFGKKKKETIV